jgi:hypothetical protein
LSGEVSLGGKRNYTEYHDNRFSGGGYHMMNGTRFTAGVGITAGYDVDQMFGVFAGYNTIRSLNLGLQMKFWR